MGMDRAAAEKERLGDLGIRHAARYKTEDLDLSLRQMIETGWLSHRLWRLRWRQCGSGNFTPGGQNSTPCAFNRPMSGATLPLFLFLTQRRSRSPRVHR